MWVFPKISFNVTNLMTAQSRSARNTNSQNGAKRSARLRHWSTLDFQSHTFQLHASSLAGDFTFHVIKIILIIADAM